MQRALFTEIPDSDGDDNFHNKKDNSGCKRNKKVIKAPPESIFKKKPKKKNKNEVDGKKSNKSSNGNVGSSSGESVAPILRSKVKVCHKGGIESVMLMGVP